MKIQTTQDVACFTHEEVVAAMKAYAEKATGRAVESIWISSSNTDTRGTQYELSARLKNLPESEKCANT